MARSTRLAAVPLFLLACLLLGGSTRGAFSNMLLQLSAVAILAWAALAQPRVQSGRHGRVLAMLVGAMVTIVVVQLVPLPPDVWRALPGRAPIASGFDLLGMPHPWMPLSLAPYDTVTSALWLLPPLAILAGILRLGAYRELWLTIALVIATFAGILLSALQVTSDVSSSPWYLYPITNKGQPVGFFANTNHMATLLLTTVPFLVAMYGRRPDDDMRQIPSSAGKIVILSGSLVLIALAIALGGSLAGIGLGIPVLAASLFVRAPIDQPRTRRGLAAVGLIGALSVAATFASPFQNNLTSAGAKQELSSRYTSFSKSLRATAEHFPNGSGVGTFVNVYPTYEDAELVDRWFINHVHNDYIEVALETGLPGILLIIVFLIWWAGRAFAVWAAPTPDYFARAASIASGAILAQSMVEFSLRTSGIAALFAVCVALMAGPRRRLGDEALLETTYDANTSRPRHLSVADVNGSSIFFDAYGAIGDHKACGPRRHEQVVRPLRAPARASINTSAL